MAQNKGLFFCPRDKLRLRCLVMILQRDEKTFQPSQRPKRYSQDQGNPQQRVNPVRRLIFDFGNQGGPNDNGAADHDDEDGGSVAGVCKGEIEAARIAVGFQRQESVEQLSLAAARATAQKAREVWRWRIFRDLLV